MISADLGGMFSADLGGWYLSRSGMMISADLVRRVSLVSADLGGLFSADLIGWCFSLSGVAIDVPSGNKMALAEKKKILNKKPLGILYRNIYMR